MALTLSRFFLIPIFGWLFSLNYIYWAVVVVIIAGLTDLLDGYLARRLNMTSDWGKLLDPLADKLLLLTVLFYLGTYKYISLNIFYLVLIKESAMIIGAGILCLQGKFISADGLGKVTTLAFFSAMLLIPFDIKAGYLGLYVAVGLMLLAFARYLLKFLRSILTLGQGKNITPPGGGVSY